MKKILFNKIWLLLYYSFISTGVLAQDSAIKESVIGMRYFLIDNKIPYLIIQSQYKLGKKYTRVKNVPLTIYIDSDSSEANLLGKVITGEKGLAKVVLPASAKEIWNAAPQHIFIALSPASKEFDETKTELSITKAKITIDTLSDGEARNITVTVTELKNEEWLPAKNVELRIGVMRLSSILAAGDEETYTTDSTGQVVAEFKKDSLPGDEKGNIILVAKTEDNEMYGNLTVEKSVPWGVNVKHENNFNKRSLFATRDKTPLWLLFIAYSIIAGVWGVLIYLAIQILKIRKLGKSLT